MSRGGFEALDPCVHCGFCLPACPTYLATGDESDSPRGRILLMRALERAELGADDPAVRQHLDACLGCRGCEPVCPAGVGYGRGLEAARELLADANGLPSLARLALAVFRRRAAWRPAFTLARWLRATGLPDVLAGKSRFGFAMGMLAASRTARFLDGRSVGSYRPAVLPSVPSGPTVALFHGCVMSTLFRRVHAATRRTLTRNGYRVVDVPGQACCGALHEHAGDRKAARELVTRNAAAFRGKADFIAVNSAGCGALLRDAAHLDPGPAEVEMGARVRDVSELLAAAGPVPGAPLPMQVAYDAPCHLEHAQGVRDAPLQLLAAIPELVVRRLPGSDRCCGSAGIFSLLQPGMSRAVLEDKIQAIAAA
ncbi:MAG TPA: heterodisulfide reductase-related iron-sulfur binding cluster, partial [Gemmatimonadales bacterium]|nr:heterodisulfide reductase-related iron-sulfur binding cluster [Gemmatimonadales bacterium]